VNLLWTPFFLSFKSRKYEFCCPLPFHIIILFLMIFPCLFTRIYSIPLYWHLKSMKQSNAEEGMVLKILKIVLNNAYCESQFSSCHSSLKISISIHFRLDYSINYQFLINSSDDKRRLICNYQLLFNKKQQRRFTAMQIEVAYDEIFKHFDLRRMVVRLVKRYEHQTSYKMIPRPTCWMALLL
jgi:hypothetical protein